MVARNSYSKHIVDFARYMQAEGYAKSTIQSYRHNLVRIWHHLGHTSLQEMTQADVLTALSKLKDEYVGATVRNVWTSFERFVNWAHTQDETVNIDAIKGIRCVYEPAVHIYVEV